MRLSELRNIVDGLSTELHGVDPVIHVELQYGGEVTGVVYGNLRICPDAGIGGALRPQFAIRHPTDPFRLVPDEVAQKEIARESQEKGEDKPGAAIDAAPASTLRPRQPDVRPEKNVLRPGFEDMLLHEFEELVWNGAGGCLRVVEAMERLRERHPVSSEEAWDAIGHAMLRRPSV